MSKDYNRAKTREGLKGINLSYRDTYWVLRVKKDEYALIPVKQYGEDSKYAGQYNADTDNGKHFRFLWHMLPCMRNRGITRIMQKKDRQTLEELLVEIEQFNQWARDNFEIKVKGE